jgi:hypothetical protein
VFAFLTNRQRGEQLLMVDTRMGESSPDPDDSPEWAVCMWKFDPPEATIYLPEGFMTPLHRVAHEGVHLGQWVQRCLHGQGRLVYAGLVPSGHPCWEKPMASLRDELEAYVTQAFVIQFCQWAETAGYVAGSLHGQPRYVWPGSKDVLPVPPHDDAPARRRPTMIA